MYDELRGQVGAALSRAAAFRKVDLHVHTTESHDFPRLSDKEGGVAELAPADTPGGAEELLARMRLTDRKLDIVAITDHNKCRVACELANLAERTGCLIIPGMEITVQCAELAPESVHITALFQPGTSSEDIDHILHESGMPLYAQRAADAKVTELQISDLVERIHRAQGVCIAAHANSDSGIRDHVRTSSVQCLTIRRAIATLDGKTDRTAEETQRLDQLRAQQAEVEDGLQNRYLTFLSRADFDAVEIQKPDDTGHYAEAHCTPLGIKPIACLLSSDAHCPRDVGMPGHTTYLKMGEPSLDGIRRAFEDPATRVRFEDEKAQTRGIEGIQFWRAEGEEGGFFRNEVIGFSDDLSCLIGGRGSGKSAVIDALRFVFMIPPEKVRDEKRRIDVLKRQTTTLAGTEVRVLLRLSDGQRMILVRRYHPDAPAPTRAYSLDGTELDIGPLPDTEYGKVTLFGWSEVEDLATNESEQRELIDGFISDLGPLVLARDAVVTDLRKSREDIAHAVREFRRLLPEISSLKQLKYELQGIDTEDMRAVFEEADTARKRATIMQSAAEDVAEMKADFLLGVLKDGGNSSLLHYNSRLP